MSKFDVAFLKTGAEFIEKLDVKTRRKVLFNIWKSREINDPKLFKKLDNELWEFRTRYGNLQLRLLAFWDTDTEGRQLVIITNGFIKKGSKVPMNELKRATSLRKQYLKSSISYKPK